MSIALGESATLPPNTGRKSVNIRQSQNACSNSDFSSSAFVSTTPKASRFSNLTNRSVTMRSESSDSRNSGSFRIASTTSPINLSDAISLRTRIRYNDVRVFTMAETSEAGILLTSGATHAPSSFRFATNGALFRADTSSSNDSDGSVFNVINPERYCTGMSTILD